MNEIVDIKKKLNVCDLTRDDGNFVCVYRSIEILMMIIGIGSWYSRKFTWADSVVNKHISIAQFMFGILVCVTKEVFRNRITTQFGYLMMMEITKYNFY